MHDLLFEHQGALIFPDLVRYAGELGLDVERFRDDLASRRHGARISRDVHGADASGAVGTPTMFVNGRRYQGSHDIDAIAAAIERELATGL
jgi:predicted DsbA family dithiol-disulfide isomerase